MEKNSHYFIVGIFVSASLLALVVFIAWLTGTHDGRHYNKYTIYFKDPVSGLQQSANVQYRGIDVGRVTNVRLAAGRSDLIKVDIEIDENTPITAKSDASLATLGVTGVVFINLTTPEGDKTPAPRIEGEEYPVIEGRGTQLSKLFQDIPAISKQILDATEKLNKVMSEENIQSLDQTFKNVERLSKNLNGLVNDQNVANINASLDNIAKASESANDMVERFNHTADQIDQTVGSINDIIERNRGNIDKFTGDGLNQITEMSRETKDMARAMRRLADKLEQNPSQLLYKPSSGGVEIQK